jgi:hypothetical protein
MIYQLQYSLKNYALDSIVANLRQTIGKLEGAIKAAHENQVIADRYMSESKAMISNITGETAMLRAERDLLLHKLNEYKLLKENQNMNTQPAIRSKRKKID